MGQPGRELVERRGLTRFQAGTYMIFGHVVMPWTGHVKSGRELVRRGFEAAQRIGDVIYVGQGRANLIRNMLAAGDPLAEAQREVAHGLECSRKVRFGFVTDLITPQLGLIRTLRGLTPTFGCFDDGQFDEREFERHLSADASSARPESYYWTRKLQARFLAGEFSSD